MDKRFKYFGFNNVKKLIKEYNLTYENGGGALLVMLKESPHTPEKDFRELAKLCQNKNNKNKSKSEIKEDEKLLKKYQQYIDIADEIIKQLLESKKNSKNIDELNER